MKKILLPLTYALAFIFVACSSDDDANSNCESCTSDLGNKFEICDNGDGTFTLTQPDGTTTITEGELEGFTPKEVIEFGCEFDGEEITL